MGAVTGIISDSSGRIIVPLIGAFECSGGGNRSGLCPAHCGYSSFSHWNSHVRGVDARNEGIGAEEWLNVSLWRRKIGCCRKEEK